MSLLLQSFYFLYVCLVSDVVLRWEYIYSSMVSIVGLHPSSKTLELLLVLPSQNAYIFILCNIIIAHDDYVPKHCIYSVFSEFYILTQCPMIVYYWAVYSRVIREPDEMFVEFLPSTAL